VGVIVIANEGRDEMYCRDCGAPIEDEATRERARRLLPVDFEPTVALALADAVHVTLLGACTACGGGRVALRMGRS
jgi:hypothetical protein